MHLKMTAERLIRLMEHPEQLDGVPYEELKTLALAYPYSPHLKQLLLLKSKQINHHEYDRNLASAAALSPDRKKLYKLIMPVLVAQPVVVKEEVLELKPIQTIRKELESMAPIERIQEQAPAAATMTIGKAPERPAIKEDNGTAQTNDSMIVDEQHNEPLNFQSWVGQFNLPPISDASPKNNSLENNTPYQPEQDPDTPNFSDKSAHDDPENTETGKAESPKNGRIAQQLAEKSVVEKEEVRSESLARILARQGYRDKAILMYQRLMLDFPEKSTIFAAAIEELKK